MSRSKLKKWKILFILCLLFFVCITAVMGSSRQILAKKSSHEKKENKQFKISTVIGVENTGKQEKDIIADVTVTNNGEDFEGNVEIVIPVSEDADSGANTAYQEAFSIKAGETKTVSIPMYFVGTPSIMRIHITDQSNQMIQTSAENMSLENADVEVIGMLTDREDDFGYITMSSADGSHYVPQYFSFKNFPDSKVRLECIDYLLVDDFDTTKWSEKQYQAVTKWVKEGGILILGTGASGEKTLAGFEKDFLDVSIEKIDKDGFATLNVTDGKETKGMQSDVTITKIKKDSGWIYVVPEDLALDFEEWRTKGLDYMELFAENLRRDKFGYLVTDVDTGPSNQYIDTLDRDKFPSMKSYAIVFSSYAGVVSIGLFFVLKKKRKLEWRWKLVPVLAIVGSVIIYGIGMKSRMTTPEMSYSRIIEYTKEGENLATTEMDFCVTSPYNEDYSMMIPEGENVYARASYAGTTMDYHTGDTLNEEKTEAYMNAYKIAIKKEGKQQMVRFQDFDSFESAFLGTRERKVKTSGTYRSDITCDKYEYSGTFTNETGYDIKHAVFLAEGRVYKLGEIKAGETVTISDKLKNGFSLYSDTYMNYGYDYNERASFVDYCDISRIYTKDTSLEEQRYAYALCQYFYDKDYVGRILEPKVIGQMSVDVAGDSICADWGMKGIGFTLGVFPVDVKEKDREEFVGDVLAKSYGLGSVSSWNRIFETYSVSGSVSSWRAFEDLQGVYEYRLEKNETLTGLYYLPVANDDKYEINEAIQSDIYYNNFEGEILAYNYDKKKYEVIFKDAQKKGIENVEAYTGKDNRLLLKFRVDEDLISTNSSVRVPVISVTKKVK